MAVQQVANTDTPHLNKKQDYVKNSNYKLRHGTELKRPRTPVVFLTEHRKENIHFAVTQHATDPTRQSPTQFESVISVVCMDVSILL